MGIIDRLLGRKSTKSSLDAGTAGEIASARREPQGAESRPLKCPGNPGSTVEGKIAFTNGERRWTESFHLVRIAAGVLRGRGHEVVERDTWLELRPSGFVLQPLLVDIELLDKGGVHTLTTIDVRHAELIRDGLFEYQHSTADHVTESLTKGFESWESVDLPVLLDALRPQPEKCTLWVMNFPARGNVPARVRRAVLGNVLCFAERPHVTGAAECDERPQAEDEHPFCNCCFLTRNVEAFQAHMESDGYFGIRFYAMRDKDGTPGADCRVNGEDYGPGMEALRSYVGTWSGDGFESRKQYVFLHTALVEGS